MTTEVGTKYDDEKPDFSLIDAEWLEEVAKVMTFGKRKYAKYGECKCHVSNVIEMLKYKPKDFVRAVITKGSWQLTQPLRINNEQIHEHGMPRTVINSVYINNNIYWQTLVSLRGLKELRLNDNIRSPILNLMLYLDTTTVPSVEAQRNYASITTISPEQFENDCVKHVTLLWDLLNADNGWKKHSNTCPSLNEVTTGAHNWRKGLAVSRLLSAALRHLWAVVRGEDNDPETGLSHLAHLSCCAMFAFWHLKHRRNLDDRYKSAQTDGPNKVPLPTRGFTGLRVGLGGQMDTNQYRHTSGQYPPAIAKESL